MWDVGLFLLTHVISHTVSQYIISQLTKEFCHLVITVQQMKIMIIK